MELVPQPSAWQQLLFCSEREISEDTLTVRFFRIIMLSCIVRQKHETGVAVFWGGGFSTRRISRESDWSQNWNFLILYFFTIFNFHNNRHVGWNKQVVMFLEFFFPPLYFSHWSHMQLRERVRCECPPAPRFVCDDCQWLNRNLSASSCNCLNCSSWQVFYHLSEKNVEGEKVKDETHATRKG